MMSIRSEWLAPVLIQPNPPLLTRRDEGSDVDPIVANFQMINQLIKEIQEFQKVVHDQDVQIWKLQKGMAFL